jgi:AcrR family transcriptional regulator
MLSAIMADAMSGGSALRRDQASAVRERILVAIIDVIEAGEEPSMRSVAQAAEISERTLYRYFASREELFAAVLPVLRERASAPMAEEVEALPDYVRRLFTTFDQNARLARALTTSSWARTNVSRRANLQALRKLIDAAFPDAAKAERESATAGLRVLYSAAGWAYLADCGFDRETSIRHVQWITKTVLERLGSRPGGTHA